MMKKSLFKRILKWSSLTVLTLLLLLFIGIGIALNFVFTPSKLTPMVQNTARQFLNADVSFEKIELTFFSTFPDFGLEISDMAIVSGVFRDSIQQPLDCDSLMTVKRCLVKVNPVAYLTKNRIVVKDFLLEQPHIYAYIDSLGVANWDIVKASPETAVVADTVAGDSAAPFNSRIKINNIRIKDGLLIFDDRSTQLYTRVNGLNLSVDGALGAKRAKLKLALTTENILFWQQGNLLVNHLAFGVETEMNRDSLIYTLNKAVFDVNGMKFGAGGTLRADSVARTLDVDLKYGIHIPSLKELLDRVPDTILQKAKEVEVRGDVLCEGTVKGLYGKKNIPLITTCFKIKDGYIAYAGMPSKVEELNMDLDAVIDLQKEQPSFLRLESFCMKGGATDIDLSGTVENLLVAPVVKMKIDADIDFDDLTKIFPLADGITCKGKIKAALKTDVLVEDVTNGNYGKLKLGGWCRMSGVEIFIPKDSITFNVRSAGLAFATNRKNETTLQGVDLLNGIVGYSGLDIHVKNRIQLKMDTTYLTLKTSPLRDTSAIASLSSTLHLGKTVVIVRDTLLVGLKQADAKADLSPSKRDKKVPHIKAELQVDSLRLRYLGNRLNMAQADIQLNATRSKRNVKIWHPVGYIDFQGLRAYTPYFPLRMRMPGTRIHFDRNEMSLDSATLKLGRSDIRLTGRIVNLAKAFYKKEELKAELFVRSKMIDCNQLMKALDAGTAYTEKVAAGYGDLITTEYDDMDEISVINDSIVYEGASSVFVVPAGIDFTFQTDIDRVRFGKLKMEHIHGEVKMKNQCIELSDFTLHSSAANMDATMIYKATDTLRAYAGFALKMHDIRIDSLVRVIPSLDTLFPMLRSFEGEVDFHISAEGWFDSVMMLELPTLRAAAYLDGHNLVLLDGETFSEISKMLMFKNKKKNLIDSISVDLMVKNGVIEIFPFLAEVDRYKVAIGGQHNIDMTFNYHVSLLKSPLPFRAGVDISGSLDKMKYRITKAKYKDLFIPSRKAKVDSTQQSLQSRIRTMLRGH